MSGPFGSSQWMYASGGFYPYEIEQSLRFNDDDSAYLDRTPASTSNRKTWTWSGWVKRGNLGTDQHLFTAATSLHASNSTITYLGFNASNQFSHYSISNGSLTWNRTTSQVFRDASAWYHIVCVLDTPNATAGDRVRVYLNGKEVTTWSTNTTPSLNVDGFVNLNTATHKIGQEAVRNRYSFDGYLAEINFIDGQALDPTSFGEFKSDIWVPKEYTGSYGTNGFYLPFSDSAAIGDDLSGNTNDWTANNLVSTDVLLDSPTNNFATLNPLDNYNTGATLSDGNLKWSIGVADGATRSTFILTSGKWYAEYLPSDYCGVVGIEDAITDNLNGTPSVWYSDTGIKRISGSVTSYGASYTLATDIIGIAVDMDAGEVTFYKNNVSQGAITLPSSAGYGIACASGGGSQTSIINFGQDSSFAGNKTAQGNTDDNGQGDFYYAPPAGFLALNTANLPDPVIDPATDDVPADYFNTVLYTGTGAAQSITGVGFQPDWTWIKSRSSGGQGHRLVDAVRGAPLSLKSHTTDAEFNDVNALTAFGSDGFDLGTLTDVNGSGSTYVAWNWLAGNGTSSNTDGSITSTVSVNQKAGFSIVGWLGTGAAGATVGHGLGTTPAMIIQKARGDGVYSWNSWHKNLSTNYYIALNTTSAQDNSVNVWPTAGITSTVFTTTSEAVKVNNLSGVNHIAYCFAEVEGFSKFGSYTGNGSADGPFVYCGFRPAFVLLKRTNSTGAWDMHDAARDPANVVDQMLEAQSSNAEVALAAYSLDFLANGFKLRGSGASQNASGGTYIFMAFSEAPFKYSNAR